MRAMRGRDTGPELAIRSALHAMDLRYRFEHPLPFDRRRRADIAFTRRKVAVLIDGCFWHGCPDDGRPPGTNSAVSSEKFCRVKGRDSNKTERLALGEWTVLRHWKLESPLSCAARVHPAVSE